MKKILFAALLSVCAIFYLSAQHVINIYHDGEKQPDVLLNVNVDSITIENGNQVFNTKFGPKAYPLTSVDSVKFQSPFLQAVFPQVKVPGMESEFTIIAMADNQSGIYPTFATHNLPDYVSSFRKVPSGSSEELGPKALITRFMLSLTENSSDTPRHFTLNATRGEDTVPIEIIQYGSRPFFTIDDKPFFGNRIALPSDAGQIEIKGPKTIIDSLSFYNIIDGNAYECDWIRARTKNDSTFIVSFDENLNNTLRPTKIRYCSSFEALSFYCYYSGTTITQLHNGSHTPEEHRKALRELYDVTDGDNWVYKENWWSDEPYYKWEGLNHDVWNNDVFWGDRLVSMFLGGKGQFNGMRGMIPESFTVFMDDAIFAPDIAGGALSGRFPEAVCNHPNWQETGWSAIKQQLWYGANIDFTGINLKLPEVNVFDYLANTRRTTSEILKENELTFIIHRAYNNSNNFNEASFVDKYLDYAPKGLGMVISDSQDDWHMSESEKEAHVEAYAARIREMQAKGIPEGIVWTNYFGKAIDGPTGSMSLIDKDGNLIWYAPMNWGLSGYENILDSYCRKILGEPVEHDKFVYDTYTSSDYSKDGEFITVKTAEEGSGVNLVFMGDGYVDKDIDDMYVNDMIAGINVFFALEPLASLFPRFNIYIMKVVSPNEFTINGEQRLKYDANNVYEYLNKIPGLTPETTHVCVIANRPSDFSAGGYADLNDNGGSIAWIQVGKASSIILHEAGGHGIGKLLDEYLTGHDDSSLSDEEKEQMRQYLTATYHARDWGLNLSFYSEPEKAPWAHMFADEDYANEVGMYQGAWMFPTICWRATENSLMNNDYSGFNAPSREAIYKQVMKASEGESWSFDFDAFKQFDKLLAADAEPNALNKAASDRLPYMQLKAPRRLMKGRDGKYISVPFDNEPQQPDMTTDKASPEVLSNGYTRIEGQLPEIPLEKGSYIIIGDQYIEGK